MTILQVRHKTTYSYKQPVQFGEHRLMSRPRDSHDLRLLDTALVITPPSAATRWMHDVFGNSIAIVTFTEPASQLVFESSFRAEHFLRRSVRSSSSTMRRSFPSAIPPKTPRTSAAPRSDTIPTLSTGSMSGRRRCLPKRRAAQRSTCSWK